MSQTILHLQHRTKPLSRESHLRSAERIKKPHKENPAALRKGLSSGDLTRDMIFKTVTDTSAAVQ